MAIDRIFENLQPGYFVFNIMDQTPEINKNTANWREDWSAVRWVFS